jgi:surface protein
MEISINQIIDLFKFVAEGHYAINTFGYGDNWEMPEKQRGELRRNYPIMWVAPLTHRVQGVQLHRRFRVFLADLVRRGEENELDVESDTERWLLDVIAVLRNTHPLPVKVEIVTDNIEITPFTESTGDNLTGHYADIELKSHYRFNKCEAAGEWLVPPPIPPNDCEPATYIVQYENGTLIETGTIPSGGSKTIDVPNPIVCENVDWQLLDSDGVVIESGSQPSGDPLTITAPDGEVTVTDSDGGVLYVVNVASDGAETQAIGDATVEVENSLGVVVDSGVVKAQGSGLFNAPDATFSINSVQVRTAPSDGSASIQVRRASGSVLVGSLQGQHWRVANSTVNVNKSDATLIQAVTVAAEATGNVNVADSVVSNSDSSYSENVKATEPLSIPDVDIEVNGNKEGEIVSVKKVEVLLRDSNNDPVNPVSVDLTGNVLELEVPSGAPPDFDPDALVIKVATFISGATNSNQFFIQVGGAGNNYNVKTSDGQTINGNTGNLSITFPSEGVYIIEITGPIRLNYQGSTSADRFKIVDILNWGKDFILAKLSDSNSIRISATDLIQNFDTDLTNSLRGTGVFYNDRINSWVMTGVTQIRGMFRNNTQFNQPLNNWDVSNVTTMGALNLGTFAGCTSFNQPLDNWDVSNVTTMQQMFSSATSFNQYLGDWNLRLAGVVLTQIFINSGMSTANYTDTIVGWANYVFNNSGSPSGVSMTGQNGMTFDTSRSGATNFTDAGDARDYLINTAGWSISGDTVI